MHHHPTRVAMKMASDMSTKNVQSHTLPACIAMNSVASCVVVLATAAMTTALAGLAP